MDRQSLRQSLRQLLSQFFFSVLTIQLKDAAHVMGLHKPHDPKTPKPSEYRTFVSEFSSV